MVDKTGKTHESWYSVQCMYDLIYVEKWKTYYRAYTLHGVIVLLFLLFPSNELVSSLLFFN
jgi:hypothetical protein